MIGYVARINHWGSLQYFQPGWEGLEEHIRYEYGHNLTEFRVFWHLFLSRVTKIDDYLPIESKREKKDRTPSFPLI